MIDYLTKWPVEAKTVVKKIDFPCVQLEQIHGNKVILVDRSTPSFLEGDAMITKEINLPLVIRHADCQVLIAYDPIQHALGIAHAGWRGQSQSIYTALIHALQKNFDSNPKDIQAAFSPSLGPTKSEFKNYRAELPEWMWAYEETSFYFNLWKIAEAELLLCGLLKENISLSTICTYLDDRFYSYRRDKTTLRNITFSKLL